jgi:Zn-dependent metalloprotease
MFFPRNSLSCILPPHILRALLEQKDKRLREIALRTLVTTARGRERRSILGPLPALAAATGQKHRRIYDAQHSSNPNPTGQQVRDEGDGPSSDQAVNQAYDGFGITYDFYQEVLNRNSIDDHGMELHGFVHYGDRYDNAFWDGQEMVFGDGDGVIFSGFTGALDVIAHELTHGVTQHTANLEYHVQSGALNESFSDVFGSLVKQYHNNETADQADWLIGAGILAEGIHGVALRSMKEPGSAYDDPKLGGKDPQPGHMEDFVELPDDPLDDSGGVHINSGIPNHAFYLAATATGGKAWEDVGHIWYETLRQLWPTAKFQDCANVIFQVAGQQFGPGSKQQQAVRDAWSEVGLPPAAPGAPAAAPKPARRRPGAAEADGQLKKQLARLAQELQKVLDMLQ